MKETPLAELTLRRYENPVSADGRELVKKLCLSVGLLQPGDSRDVVVDVLHVLLESKGKRMLTSEEVKDAVVKLRKKNNMPLVGVASSNVRRQLKRLRDVYMIEKVRNNYRITEDADMVEIFDEKLQNYLLRSLIERVREHYKRVDEVFS